MTLLEHLQEWEEENGKITTSNAVAVTCINYGKGEIINIDDHPHFPIDVKFRRENETITVCYTETGRTGDDAESPALALGHYDTQLECAQAIKEQNFDME